MTTMAIKGSATLQDLLNTPKDGNKYELVDGEIVMSPAGMRHSEVAVNIAGLTAAAWACAVLPTSFETV